MHLVEIIAFSNLYKTKLTFCTEKKRRFFFLLGKAETQNE